ncbi:hypothetical protein [Botrimarina sp.]|uniref:hypothetical protein n=1 Tax=Botrimarina sp. TaxID=2795802 RepID=UPI0032EC050D
MRIRTLLAFLSAALVAPAATAIEFNEIARFDVSFAFASDLDPDDEISDDNPQFIGTNPLGVAWNGSKLYLAGHDNFGSSLLPIGLIEVLNPTRTGTNALTSADFSAAFGQIFQPAGRGYTNLELSGDRLAAAYDGGSPGSSDAFQLFDTTDNSLVWDLTAAGLTARGGAGVSFDPGFEGADASPDVAYTAFGSGRRGLLDRETGQVIYSLTTDPLGFQWLPDTVPGGNIARDMAFDPATGDIYVRRNNDVDAADRTGVNSTDNRRTIFDDASDSGAFKLGQKLEFIGGTSDGDVIIFNDSVGATTDQAFLDVVKVIDTNGVEQTATFNLLDGLTGADIGPGAGIYDFDYDPTTNTLAVLDFFNRNVFIFEVGAGVAPLVGDYNRDGAVNAADYTVYRDNLGDSVVNPGDGADGNENGVIDTGDYAFWADNYGASASSAVATPEPTAAALALVTLAGLAMRRRRG